MLAKILSPEENAPPPPLSIGIGIWAEKYRFFKNRPKSPKNCLQGYFLLKFSFLRSKKSKIVILVVEITLNGLGAIFQKIHFFHDFRVFSPLKGQKYAFFQNSQNFTKLRFQAHFFLKFTFLGSKKPKMADSRGYMTPKRLVKNFWPHPKKIFWKPFGPGPFGIY